mgnify:CR=1 FL=1
MSTDPDSFGGAIYIGLGDAAIPAVLVVSAALYGPGELITPLGVTLPALGTMVGITAGLAGLLWVTARGRVHAGLPLLNTGAIGGYLLGAVAIGIGPMAALGL